MERIDLSTLRDDDNFVTDDNSSTSGPVWDLFFMDNADSVFSEETVAAKHYAKLVSVSSPPIPASSTYRGMLALPPPGLLHEPLPDRLRGMITGLALGDAFTQGSLYLGRDGQISHYTMTNLCLLQYLQEEASRVYLESGAIRSYLNWYKSSYLCPSYHSRKEHATPPISQHLLLPHLLRQTRSIGVVNARHRRLVAPHRGTAEGLLRVIALAALPPAVALRATWLETRLTDPHPLAILGAQLYVTLLRCLLEEDSSERTRILKRCQECLINYGSGCSNNPEAWDYAYQQCLWDFWDGRTESPALPAIREEGQTAPKPFIAPCVVAFSLALQLALSREEASVEQMIYNFIQPHRNSYHHFLPIEQLGPLLGAVWGARVGYYATLQDTVTALHWEMITSHVTDGPTTVLHRLTSGRFFPNRP